MADFAARDLGVLTGGTSLTIDPLSWYLVPSVDFTLNSLATPTTSTTPVARPSVGLAFPRGKS